MRSIYGSLRGTILSRRRGCSGSDNFQYFSRTTVMQRSSEPHLLTSKFLLSKSVVKVIICMIPGELFIRHSLFARHAQPSLLPVKEAVSVLAA